VASPLNPRALGKAIAEERRSKGLKQKQVVERISSFYSDERSYRRVELGERLPDRDAVIAILESGLSVNEADKINRILALGGYAPLTAAEAQRHGASVLQPIVSPATPIPPRASFWHHLNEKSGLRFAISIAVCSLAVGCAIAAVSKETALVMASAILYGCLYAVSILLESAFAPAPAPKWPVASAVFGFILVTSVMALVIDSWLARIGIPAALPLSLAVFLIAAAAQWSIARPALSNAAVVPTRFQAHTAQAAHLKNTVYFLVIVILFWLLPFHCIVVLRREIQSGHAAWVRAILARRLLLGRDFVCLSAEWLWLGFLFLLLLAIPMAVRLLENLKSDPRLNAYTALLYLRGILYFLLIFICLIWYSAAVASLSF
jgi:transcriptional regulator with XRE-family HTH domain